MGTVHAKERITPESVSAVGQDGKKFNLSQIPARVDKVHIDGLKRTKDDIVVETVQDLFQSSDFAEVITNANRVRKNLEELGCFKNVEIFIDTSSDKSSSKDGLEVTFLVKELNRLKGNIHTMVGENEGSLVVGVQAPNLCGRGEKFQVESSFRMRSFNNLDLSFTKPLRTKRNAMWTTSVFLQKAEFPWSGYQSTDRGLLLDLAFNSVGQLKHNLQYEASWRELGQISKNDTFAVRQEYGHTLKSALRHILTLDRRDSSIFPSEGAFLKVTSELAGLGGNIGFLKNEVQMQVNIPLPAGFVLQGSAQGGVLQPMFENKTHTIADRFYLGGPTSVRGFQTRGIGPRADNQSVGSNVYWASGLHLYSPLPFRPGRSVIGQLFRLHFFTNIGQSDRLRLGDTYRDTLQALIRGYRASYGAGVVLRIGQMAQIEVNYVVPFMFRNTDALSPGVQFGLGIHFL